MNAEMIRLIAMLENAHIPYECQIDLFDCLQVIYYDNNHKRICDAICNPYSYGGDVNLLEMMGLISEEINDEVEGYLTADVVFNRIKAYHDAQYKPCDGNCGECGCCGNVVEI